MATYFTRKGDNKLVALRSWGGNVAGVVVRLYPDAVRVTNFDEILDGDDGSQRSLRALASEAGRGGRLDRFRRWKRREEEK